MSVVFSGQNSGSFTSTGQDYFLPLPSGVDTMWVYNETVLYAPGVGIGAQYYWQYGMVQGRGLEYVKIAANDALSPMQIPVGAGFYLYDSSLNVPGPSLALTGITNANPPFVNTANTASLANGDIVRIFNT